MYAPGVLEPFHLVFVQRGVLEVAALAIGAGLVGTWIVLRGLAFYAHAVGSAAFPGLVLADGLGFSAHLGAGATALVVAGTVGWVARRDHERYDSATALVLVAALAAGVLLASDVFHSGAHVETLLFGSLLVISPGDVWFAAGASAVVLLALRVSATAGWRRLRPRSAQRSGSAPPCPTPCCSPRRGRGRRRPVGRRRPARRPRCSSSRRRRRGLLCSRMRPWQLATVAVDAVEGVAGLWLSVGRTRRPGPRSQC